MEASRRQSAPEDEIALARVDAQLELMKASVAGTLQRIEKKLDENTDLTHKNSLSLERYRVLTYIHSAVIAAAGSAILAQLIKEVLQK